MSDKDLTQTEEELDSTPQDGSDFEDSSEFDELFAADESQEELSSEEKVAMLEKKLSNIEKGVQKFFSEQGKKTKQEGGNKASTETKPVITDDVSELFFAQIPQAELVSSDLRTVADKLYGGSILKAWKGESWIQDKASMLAEKIKEQEVNKQKISKPSSGTSPGAVDISKVKEADVVNLPAGKKMEWLKMQAQRERESDN